MPLKVTFKRKKKKQKYLFAENEGVQKQLKCILRTSVLSPLSPDNLLLDQNCLLFINVPSNGDSQYKHLATTHTLMGRSIIL